MTNKGFVNVYALYIIDNDLVATKSVDGTPSQSIIHSATDSGDYYRTALHSVHCSISTGWQVANEIA